MPAPPVTPAFLIQDLTARVTPGSPAIFNSNDSDNLLVVTNFHTMYHGDGLGALLDVADVLAGNLLWFTAPTPGSEAYDHWSGMLALTNANGLVFTSGGGTFDIHVGGWYAPSIY
jgi:hypothetical protein